MNDYQKEAKDFCEKYNVKIISVYTGHRKYFPDDKTARACFSVTIIREGKTPYTFDFGQSLNESYKAREGNFGATWQGGKPLKTMPQSFDYERYNLPTSAKEVAETRVRISGKMVQWFVSQAIIPPTEYDILASVTKYDPGTFDDFCSDYGYDTDSKKAEKTYFAVQKEWSNIIRLFSDCMDELQEIS